MTSSERRGPARPVPMPSGEPAPIPGSSQAYARFIPREEVRTVAAWSPNAFPDVERRSANGDRRRASAPAEAPEPAVVALRAEHERALQAARQAGYQDGYRDGLVALENFKQSVARQITAQVGQLFEACDSQLEALQVRLADSVTDTAVRLARQVVREELRVHPDRVAAVARESVEALLASARRIELHAHPDDVALVAQGAAELLERRGVRLVADASIERGGCRVSSDIGQVDSTMAERWKAVAALVGRDAIGWADDETGAPE